MSANLNGSVFLISIFLNWETNLVFPGNLSKKDATKLKVKDNFLQELIEIWADFNYKDSFDSQRDFSGSLIWNNSLVRIAGEAVFYKNWAKAGVKNIKDLMNDECEVITYRNFKEKYCFHVSFLEFYGVALAIRSAMKILKMKSQSGNDQGISVQKLFAATKPTKLAYEILINKKSTRPKKSQEKWVRDCKLQAVEDLNWTFIYSLPRICAVSTKLRSFQFKFLHRRIATNSFLFKIRISDTALCYLCKTDEETLIHLYWECSVTKSFGQSVKEFFVTIHLIPASHVLDMYECLGFGGEEDDVLLNHCLLLARYYIHCCKFKNVSSCIGEYVQRLKFNFKIEKQVSVVTGSENKFQQR